MKRLIVLLAAGAGLGLAQTPPVVANGTAEPSQIRIGVASKVRFYADIGDPNLVAGSVNLQRIGAAGTNPVVVGTLHDDGTAGDEIAGDGRYSIEITLNEPASNITFVISAAIRNQIVRPKSNNIVVSVLSNRPPVAVTGDARAGRTGTAITLDGRKSYDLDGDLLAFSWTLSAKPTGSTASLDNSTFVKPAFTPDMAGTYRASLIVNDGQASSVANEVVIQVSASNAAPTAMIGGTLQLPFGAGVSTTVALNGSGSSDPENSPLTYLWRIVSKPASSTAPMLAPLTGATPTLTADKPGRYVIELVVNDGVNASAPIQATIILYKPNTPPAVSAGPDQTVTTATPVNLTGSATDADAGDTIASLSWAFIARPAGSVAVLQNANTATPLFTPDVNGDYLIELTATDSRGVANRARVVIRRSAPITGPVNQAPTVSAGLAQTITLPATASLLATATDDGLPNPPAALSITWIIVSGPTTVTFSNPSALGTTATFYSTGTFLLRVTASDGALSASSDVTITVNDTGPKLPIIQDRTIPLGTRFQTRIFSTDTNLAATATLSLDAAPTGAGFNPLPVIDWMPTAAQLGSNTFIVRATDSLGRFDTKTFHVTVTNPNHPPVMADQADASIAMGSLFTRTLTATDPDAAETLTFGLVSGPAGMTLSGANLSWSATGAASSTFPVLVQVTDHAGAIDAKKFVLTVLPSSPPVATDDSYSVRLGTTLSVPATGVLANDVSPLAYAMTASKLTDPTKGTLTSFAADGSFSYQAPPTLPGPVFQPVVKTNVEGSGYFLSNPIVADLDGDGKAEIIMMVGGGIRAYRENGTILWDKLSAFPAPYTDCNVASFAVFAISVGDIDDDGRPDVVFPASCGRDSLQPGLFTRSRFAAFNGFDGSLKWVSPPLSVLTVPTGPNYNQPGFTYAAQPTIARLRSNESPSILLPVDASGITTVGVDNAGNAIIGPSCMHLQQTVPDGTYHYPDASSPGHYFACRGVFVLNGTDGSLRQSIIVARGAQGDIGYENVGDPAVIVADLNQDGAVEIVAGSVTYALNGTVLSHQGSSRTTETAIGNFDDTPDIEVVRYEHVYQATSDILTVYKADGTVVWRLPFPTQTVVSKLTVADVDGSGRPSIILNLYSTVCAIDYKGSIKWCYDTTVNGIPKVTSRNRHAVFDLDGDGVPEVIVSAVDKLLFLDGRSGKLKYSFDIASISNSVIDQTSGANVNPAPVVSDTDGSGHAKIVFTWFGSASGPFGNARLTIIESQNHDWSPARQIMNQAAYFLSNVNNNGTIPGLPLVNNFATPATNVFATQAPIGTPIDPRVHTSTSFTYKANAGGLSSAAATVNIDLLPANRPPVFTSIPPTRYLINNPFTYTAHAVDPDAGDTVHYSLSYYYASATGTCTIDSFSGFLSCNNSSGTPEEIEQITILATDNQGESATQTVLMKGSAGNSIVPNVVGLTQSAAQTAITSAGFTVGTITQAFSSAPAGQVTGQSPAGSGSQLSGELVSLTISKGPTPVPVPFVTGQALTSATTTLSVSGFTTAVTRVFSNTVPANIVISQSPAAGTVLAPVATNPVALTVSSGNGLRLRLNRSVTTSDQLITVTPLATDANGNPASVPSLSYSITAALTPFPGTIPTISGTTITPGALTQGLFTLTATDSANGRSAAINFGILPPRVSGKSTHGESFASFIEALETIHAMREPLLAARAANNTAQMTSILRQMVTVWRTVDLDDLKLSFPLVTATQFAPAIADMPSLGLTPSPADLMINQVLRDACDDIQAFTDGLKAQGTSIAQLQALADHFSTRAARLDGLTLSVAGGVYNQREYTRLMSRRLPAFYEALMEEVAVASGLTRRTPTFSHFGKNPLYVPVRPQSTLAELSVTTAVDFMLDKVMDYTSQTYKNSKQLAVDIMGQAAWNAGALVITGYLKQFALGGDIVEVISGASISFREFNEPLNQAIIEVPTDALDPQITTVMIIGPDVFNEASGAVKDIYGKTKDVFSFGLDPATNPLRAKNLNDAKTLMRLLYDKIKGVGAAVTTLQDIVDNAYQEADTGLHGCIFSSDPACSQLVYSSGIVPVYRYAPPPGFGGIGGLPEAIVFIVQNDHGMMYFASPLFMPALPKPPAPGH